MQHTTGDLCVAVVTSAIVGVILGIVGTVAIHGKQWERKAIAHGAASYAITSDGESLKFKWNDELTDGKVDD